MNNPTTSTQSLQAPNCVADVSVPGPSALEPYTVASTVTYLHDKMQVESQLALT